MKTNLVFSSIILLLSVGACRTSGDIQREKEMNDLKQELSRVQVSSADTGQNLDSVRDDIQKVIGRVERLEHNDKQDRDEYLKSNTELRQRLSDLEEKLDKSIKGINDNFEALKKDFQAAVKKIDDVSANAEKIIAAGIEGKDSKKEPADELKKMDVDIRYKKARKFHNAKNYSEAERFYASVVGTRSKWYDERAKFYLGSLFFEEGKFKDAVMKLQELIDGYPNSQYAPSALLVQGKSFIKLKQLKDAKVFFQDLLSKFPNSKEAKEAKERLKKL